MLILFIYLSGYIHVTIKWIISAGCNGGVTFEFDIIYCLVEKNDFFVGGQLK